MCDVCMDLAGQAIRADRGERNCDVRRKVLEVGRTSPIAWHCGSPHMCMFFVALKPCGTVRVAADCSGAVVDCILNRAKFEPGMADCR